MKAYLVSNGDEAPSQTWAWIEAESADQIHSVFHSLIIHEPLPDWATRTNMEEFGAYSVTGPVDPWLEKLRRKPPPLFSAVLRISNVKMARADLESALQAELDRFEPMRAAQTNYAQLDIPLLTGWHSIDDFAKTLGYSVSLLRQDGKIGDATIDVAISFAADAASLSIPIPSHTTKALNQYGLGLELSVYLTDES